MASNIKNICMFWDSDYFPNPEKEKINPEQVLPEYALKGIEHILEIAEKNGMRIYNTHYDTYQDRNISKAYRYTGTEWKLEKEVPISTGIDKFHHTEKAERIREKLHRHLDMLNPIEITKACRDKLRYRELSHHVPETLEINRKSIKDKLPEIKSEKIILKPKFGAEGKGIKILEKTERTPEKIREHLEKHKKTEFLLQEFKDTSKGIPETSINHRHDFRTIIINGKIRYAFVRENSEGYLTNVSEGAKIHPFKKQIPRNIKDIVREIDQNFKHLGRRIYSVDFMFDKQGVPWVLELNSRPGISISPGAAELQKKWGKEYILTLR